MKRFVGIAMVLALLAAPAVAQKTEQLGDGAGVPAPAGPGTVSPWLGPEGNVLYDNGPLINVPGGGFGGADLSMLENVTLGMTTLGAANQGPASTGNRMADDFTVPDEGWRIDACTFFAYQTGSPTAPSPMSAFNVQVWDGSPDDPMSSVIAGDLTTNVLASTTFTNIYRAAETTPTDNLRAIFAIEANLGGLELAAGTYWFDWAPTGSASFSGPWAPPIAILGQSTTGNGLQFFSGAWQAFEDGGTFTPQGLPFICTGEPLGGGFGDPTWTPEIPTVGQIGLIALLLGLAGAGIFRLRRR